MKIIPFAALFLLVLNSCSEPSIIAHWKCDETGDYETVDPQGELITTPVTNLYNTLAAGPMEVIFQSNGQAKTFSSTAPEKIWDYKLNYNNNPRKILMRQPQDHSEDMIVTINCLTNTTLNAKFFTTEDNFNVHLNMDKQ